MTARRATLSNPIYVGRLSHKKKADLPASWSAQDAALGV
jgi:hypothetical protein